MRDYPERVRSVILDSMVPIAIDLIAVTPASIDRAFQALFDACSFDAACSRHYPDLKGVLGTVDVPLVSVDFNHNPLSSAFDLTQTQVVDGTFVRILSWYDNEWGFSNRMSDTAVALDGAG